MSDTFVKYVVLGFLSVSFIGIVISLITTKERNEGN